MSVLVQKHAPDFNAKAVLDGEFIDLKLTDYRGQYVILYFYPLDFTFVCPTEIISFSDRMAEFKKRNTAVIGVSVDSQYSHYAWLNTPRNKGGLGKLGYPLVADLNKKIARDYDVLTEDGTVALRGLFLIDRNGVVRHQLVNDLPLGRNVDEAIRVIDALQHFEQHGEVCPANWKPGGKTMKADPVKSLEYFESVHK
jgi:alkyl hydroperoxide reductase subunit AhpC